MRRQQWDSDNRLPIDDRSNTNVSLSNQRPVGSESNVQPLIRLSLVVTLGHSQCFRTDVGRTRVRVMHSHASRHAQRRKARVRASGGIAFMKAPMKGKRFL